MKRTHVTAITKLAGNKETKQIDVKETIASKENQQYIWIRNFFEAKQTLIHKANLVEAEAAI